MNDTFKNKFPEIETERLILNQPVVSDIENLVRILNKEIYARNTVNIPFPYDENSAEFWINLSKKGFEKMSQYVFAIRLKETVNIIGGVSLRIDSMHHKAEIGYWLDEKYWNRGLMSEAVRAVINFGFEKIKLKKIYATHIDYNPASGKVMEKCGMQLEGVLKCHTYRHGVYQNHILYAIINE